MRQDYYTYAYLREDGTPYYIGKGRRNRIHHPRSRAVGMPPMDRRVYLKRGLCEFDAYKHEMYMINLYGRKDLGTGILRNKSNGGDGANSGGVMSQETRDKISAANKGRKQTPEWIEKRISKGAQTLSKEFIVIPPDGDPYIYKGKRNFCRKMGWDVYKEIRINEVIKGKKKSYKGYKFEEI